MRPKPLQKIKKGQRWRNKKTGLDVVITGSQSGNYKTMNPYGSPKAHTISERTLRFFWELVG